MYGKRYGNNFFNLKIQKFFFFKPATQMATVNEVLNQSLFRVDQDRGCL